MVERQILPRQTNKMDGLSPAEGKLGDMMNRIRWFCEDSCDGESRGSDMVIVVVVVPPGISPATISHTSAVSSLPSVRNLNASGTCYNRSQQYRMLMQRSNSHIGLLKSNNGINSSQLLVFRSPGKP